MRIITDLHFVAANVDASQMWFVRRRLKQAGVTLLGSTVLTGGPAGWARSWTRSRTTSPIATPDLIVYAGLRSARDDLVAPLAEALPDVPVRQVGDALAPRALLDAVAEGAAAGASASATG